MVVTVTSLRLRSLWGFFTLSWHGFQISKQARKQKGFIQMKNTGFGYLHYTMSSWETVESALAFARSGAHLQAMKQSAKLATEVRIFTYSANQLPTWVEGKQRLITEGRVYTYA